MKNTILILLILFLYSCGYSTVYKTKEIQDFQITLTNMQGDNEFNNLIKNELNLYSNKNAKKNYNISINSDYIKNIISKNTSGVASNYNLTISTNIKVNLNNNVKTFKFKESVNIKNNTDSFEQNNYEKNIKKNIASIIREKLIIKLLDINDY
jgi:outer membrane lipopolysaccharide assembly protein LptE/RlpB